MSTIAKLSKNAYEKNVKQKLYKSMIGSLLYLIVSRPDISFSVGTCARYQANLKESHLMPVKRIIRYINETLDYGLWYPYDFFLVIVGYSNVDWAKIEKTHLVFVMLLVIILWLDLVRNNILYLYLLPKQSISLLGAIVWNSYG